ERTRRMQSICERHGVPLAAAALQFSLRDPRITSTVVGMTRPERLMQTVKLAQHPVPDALWAELETEAPSPGDPEAGRFI
ncbi:MAG TPA: aldo/keto reductase, partial [Chloroflexota bacterium]|nr:aldo/keto reductase [Chloroflexota bacterium]